MARNKYALKGVFDVDAVRKKSSKWFSTNGYRKAQFKNGTFSISQGSYLTPIYYSLKERSNYITYFRSSYASSLLVFEVCIQNEEIDFECYTPLILFGLFRVELTFKQKTSWITKYRKEGFRDMISYITDLGII